MGRVERACHEHDRDWWLLRPALGDELVASLTAQMDVEHDDVDLLLLQCLACGRERVSLEDFMALELEIDSSEQPDRRFVVNHQDPGRRRMPPGIAHRRESNERGDRPYPRRGSARLTI